MGSSTISGRSDSRIKKEENALVHNFSSTLLIYVHKYEQKKLCQHTIFFPFFLGIIAIIFIIIFHATSTDKSTFHPLNNITGVTFTVDKCSRKMCSLWQQTSRKLLQPTAKRAMWVLEYIVLTKQDAFLL